MKPDQQHLLRDLLAGDDRSAATLLAASRILRRRRQWRALRQTAMPMLVGLGLAGLFLSPLHHRLPAQATVQVVKAALPPAQAPNSKPLTDDELLALFPNTPVALATLPNGKKLLLFLRPADQAKYLSRL